MCRMAYWAQAMNLLPILFVASLLAQQTPDIRVDVDLVTVACSVTDSKDAPAAHLKKDQFSLRDEGESREIRDFWQEADLPLTVALVVDASGSQAGYVKSHRDAVADFLHQVIGPADRAMLVEIAQQARLLSSLTGSGADIDRAVQEIGSRQVRQAPMLGPPCRNAKIPHSCGGTALWHGIYYAAKELKPVSGRKAIIVLSDGIDTGSDVPLTDAVEMARSVGAVVYAIKYATPMRFLSLGATIAQAASHGLERLSKETGGVTFPNPGRRTSEVFAQIEAELRNLYVLGFTPPEAARDGKLHKLAVGVSGENLTARCRSGYRAENEQK